MVEGAVYDAVNAIDRGYRPYLVDLDAVGAQPWDSQDAAVATAAYRVLRTITPAARHAGLDAAYAATLCGDSRRARRSREALPRGRQLPRAMLDARDGDGFLAPFAPVIGTDPGDWRPLGWPAAPAFDPDGWVGNLKPFLIESPSQFRSKGPNEVTSRRYAKDFNEVKRVGSLTSTTRTADQTAAAVFWQFAPIALWNPLARGARRPVRPRYGGPGSPLRDDQPRRRRRRDRLLERQVLLELLAPEGCHPGGGHRRQPGDDRRSRAGSRSSIHRRRPCHRSSRRRSPTTPRVTAA